MCDTCGCNITPGNRDSQGGKLAVDVLKGLLSDNDYQAQHNREHFDKYQVLALNLMSSPGSGKTRLLEATIDALKDEVNIAVIEGDLETENDAERIRDKGVPAVQISTGTACHLDAHMVHTALHQLDLNNLDLLFIENVGNLVCPASFDLGHHANITLLSVTEGDDKPSKYPVMFRAADVMLVTKTDLLAVIDDFNPLQAQNHLRELANPASVIQLSAKTGQGMQHWLSWLRNEMAEYRNALQHNVQIKPAIQPTTQSDGQHLHAKQYQQGLPQQ